MSIYFAGTFKRSGGVLSAVGKQIKMLNFKAVNRVTIKFDPFDSKASTLR
jgi:large subunit ribosomal protein L53